MMLDVRHILVATDFSEGAARARKQAAVLARLWGAELTLVHVYNPTMLVPEGAYPAALWSGVDFTAALKAECEKLLAEERRLLEPLSATTVLAAHPSAALGICHEAEERGVDLVVVGTQGRTALSRLLLGSVAERVVRLAPCSVMAVRNKEGVAQHILCATDLSPSGRAALIQTAWLAARAEARVTLLHVEVREPPIVPWPFAPVPQAEMTALLRDELRRQGGELLQGCEVAVTSAPRAASGIADYAESHGCDLIVVATHGRTGIPRLTLGSVAEHVVRHAERDVWVARERAG
jgi:nucleotide-binding universal stress UspA family protein